MIRALYKQARRPGVALAWLTTWGPAVENLITEAFGGLLAGGYLVAGRLPGRYVPMYWKLDALATHLEELGGSVPFVWMDGEAVASALAGNENFDWQTRPWMVPRMLFDCSPRG